MKILSVDKIKKQGLVLNYQPLKLQRGKPKGGKKRDTYFNAICAFDIETSNLPGTDDAFMYIWQFSLNNDFVIIGRTWEEYIEFTNILKDYADQYNATWVCFIHNASFEFQFLSGIFNFQAADVFCMDSRKVAYAKDRRIEYRCSYIQTNMSLAEFTRKMNVKHQKQSGEEFDYSEIRYPWTPIYWNKLKYCIYDVVGLVEALKAEMEGDHDNIYTLPLTATGYTRRDCKTSMRTYNKDSLKRNLPNYEVFELLDEGFRGGDTHSNRAYTGTIVKDAKSADRSSSYPDQLINELFPIGEWQIETNPKRLTFERILELMNKRKKAVIMQVAFYGVRLRYPEWGCPYLARHKCHNVKIPQKEIKLKNGKTKKVDEYGFYDNGRIIAADYLVTTITDVDLRIILEEYDIKNIVVIKYAYSTYGKLPDQLRSVVKKYYELKTSLKNVENQETYYMKMKNRFNAIYGMIATSPIRLQWSFTDNEEKGLFELQKKDKKTLLDEANEKAFLSYSWAVWCTALARWHLHQMIKIVSFDSNGNFVNDFVYCDTDSVKYIGDHDFSAYNKKRIAQSKANGGFAYDKFGECHYMGVAEPDGYYKRFKSYGSKKYVYEDEKGKLHVTIAGVNKKKGAAELEKAGGLKAFKEGFVFKDAGGLESIYNDSSDYWVKIDGHDLHITRNVSLHPSTYTVGVTQDYEYLLNYQEHWLEVLDLSERFGYNID